MKVPIINVAFEELVPPPALFAHPSTLHGQSHVGRVMVHAFRLLEATGSHEEATRLWAAVYLHDLARTHDGGCHRHGADAIAQFATLPILARAGVQESDHPAITTAVAWHCLPAELPRTHPHWLLTSLLKDADGLDRVRLGYFDLDPHRLRHPEARAMVDFAWDLFEETDGVVPNGPNHFAELWPAAVEIEGYPVWWLNPGSANLNF